MKTRLFFTFLLVNIVVAAAQSDIGRSLLSQLPSLPDNCCGISQADDAEFRDQIDKVLSTIENEKDLIENNLQSEDEVMKSLKIKTPGAQSASDLYKITLEIQELEAQVNVFKQRWADMSNKYGEAEKNAKLKLDRETERVNKSAPKPVYKGEHISNQHVIDAYFKKNIPPLHLQYCNTVTPLYKSYLATKRSDIYQMFVLLDKIAVSRAKMLKIQTGINQDVKQIQKLQALALVEDYAKSMMEIGTQNINEDNF